MQNRLASFMEQGDHVALVVRCGQAEAPVVLRGVQGVDEVSASDLFWVWGDRFVTAGAYVKMIAAVFSAEIDRVRAAQATEGMPVWPEVPANVRAAVGPPVQAMRNLMVYARSLIPHHSGLLGWGLIPMEVVDPAGWTAFASELVKHEHPFPWCHHMRMYLRDMADPPLLTQATKGKPRIDHCWVDLSHATIEQGLKEDAADDTLPLGDRMQAVLMLAGIDQSHKRHDDALNKYRLVATYAGKVNNPPLAAAAYNGMGETYEAMNRPQDAQKAYGVATQAAGEGGVPAAPVMLNTMLNTGNLAYKQERWGDAEGAYQNAEHLAGLQSSPKTRVQCMEQRGVAVYMQGRKDEALSVWDTAIVSARAGGFPDLEESVLGKQRDHYMAIKDDAGVARTEQRIAEARSRAAQQEGKA